MTLRELKLMVKAGEGSTIEFKSKLNHPEKVVREAVAFANTDGGHLLIGVSDEGEVTGVKHPAESDFLMQKTLAELSRPALTYQKNIIPLSDQRAVLHYYIPKGNRAPYFALLDKRHSKGKAYVRVADKSVQASREVRTLLKLQRQEVPGGFTYGENEKKLLQYLDQHPYITLRQYHDISALPEIQASEILIKMCLSNVLKVIPSEQEDRFVFSG